MSLSGNIVMDEMTALNNAMLEYENLSQIIDNNNKESVAIKPTPAKCILETTSLIAQLCKRFYQLGWLPGSGGGMAIRKDGLIYCTPSGVEKEVILAEDVIVMVDNTEMTRLCGDFKLKCSDCLCLFMLTFAIRDAGCCIHSHSTSANLITLLCCSENSRHEDDDIISSRDIIGEFRISNQEMIKAIKKGSSGEAMLNTDTLVVPIIKNGLRERDLSDRMHSCMLDYPMANAVLVENHGVFVWGRSWKETKIMAESYDYLFKLKLEASKYCLDSRLT